MATRAQVETAIQTIQNNGNNTAKTVRDALTSILNYTENEEFTSEHSHFRIRSNEFLEDRQGAQLWYSLDGFKGYSVNFTIKLLILNDGYTKPNFELDKDVYNLLREIIKTDNLCFTVGLYSEIKTVIPIHLFISLKEENRISFFLSHNTPPKQGQMVFTSIHLHSPEKFGK